MADTNPDDPRFSTLTPERIAKGDLDYSLYSSGAIRSAQRKDTRIVGLLVDRRQLDETAISNARTFTDWRAAYMGEAGHHEPEGAPGEFSKADKYKLLIRCMPKHLLDIVTIACELSPSPREMSRALADPSDAQTAFECLDRCVIDIIKDYLAVFDRLVKPRN